MPTTLDITQIHGELQALRQQVALLQQQVQRPRVALVSSRPAPFLGQPVVITGTVTDGAGVPQVGASVVVSTTWGRLKSRDRLLAEQGTSLMVVTGAEGQFSVDLLPLTSEDPLAVQQEALEIFLARLDATAATPRQTEADLREMAHLYQWDVNHAYRQALDIYFRDFGDGLLESVNRHDYLQQWDYLEATVVAYVQQPGGTTVEGLGALMVPFKQWLGPWLEVFLALSQAQNPLPTMLNALQKTSSLGNLQGGVYRQVSDYVGSQSGIVGAYIGRKVVENTVQSFLLGGQDDLEVSVKADLAPSLQVATGLLAAGGVSGLQSVVQTRSQLKQEVGTQIESSGIAVGALTDRVTGMATQLSGLQSNLGTVAGRVDTLQVGLNQFDNRLGGLDTDVGGLREQVGGFQSRFTQFDQQVGGLSTDVLGLGDRIEGLQGRFGQFDSTVSGLNDQFEGLRGQFNQVDRNVSGLSEQVGGLQGRFAQVDDQVGRLSSSVTGLTNQFGTLQGSFERLDTSTTTRFNQIGTRLGTLEGRVTVVDSRFGTVVSRVDTLDTMVTDFGNTLGTLDRTVADLGGSFGPVSDRLDTQDKTIAALQEQNQAFDGRLTTIQTSNQDMDGRVTQLNQEVVGLRQDTVSLNQGITQVNTSVDGLQRNVSTLNNQVNGLDTRVTTVQGGLTTLTNRVGTLDTRVVTLDTRMGTLDSRVGGLDIRVGGITRDVTLLNTSVGTLQTSVSQFDTRLTTVGGQVGRLETNVSTLDGRFTNLNGQVGGIERNLSNLTRVSTDRIGVLENSISRVGNNVLSLRTDLNR